MRLFLISQNVNNGYQTYDSAVVAAEYAEDAAYMHPCGGTLEEHSWRGEWAAFDDVMAQYLGEAHMGMRQGVICASYNAG